MSFRYLLFHKPYGVLSQFTSQEGHRTLAEFGLPKEIYAAGRLDKDSEGLLLLTNDGAFIKRFLDSHPRIYWVQVDGDIDAAQIAQLERGVDLKDGRTRPCRVKKVEIGDQIPPRDPPVRFRKSIPTSWVEMTLTEGKNRQVRRMTAAVGHPTLRLLRVGMGKLKLDLVQDLPPGEFREVTRKDLI